MKHFSHPHALNLTPLPEKEEDGEEIICSGCEQKLSSPEAYTCTKRKCDFILHGSCFELPKKKEHKSHPNHALTLLAEPPSDSLYYNCYACGVLINGFSFNCNKCDRFRLHVTCASLPESVDCKAHLHPLELLYHTPKPDENRSFTYCLGCDNAMKDGYWSYYCKECNFCTNLECAFTAEG